MQPDLDQPFYISAWRIQPRQNRIYGPAGATRVEPKMMEVLCCLATHPGEVVTRDELLETAWAGTVVTDDVLTRSISELRKVFGDDPRQPQVIETIPKTGYRLIAPVTPDHRGDSVPPDVPALDLVSPSPRPASPYSRKRPAVWIGMGVLVLIVLGALALWQRTEVPTPPVVYHPVPLTTFPGSEGGPAFSPDGNQIAFTWRGPENDNLDIYLKLVSSETPLRLTDDPAYDHNPAWSPDGTQVAFMRSNAEGCTIYVVPALGGPARRLASCGANIYGDLAWSPDGAWLAFNDKAAPEEVYSIHLLSPTTLEARQLTTPPSNTWGDHDPAFSPEGNRLSFTRSVSEGMQDIYTISLDGGAESRLTTDSRNIFGHTWTPDGNRLVFASNRTGPTGLWEIAVSGGTPSWVGLSDGRALFPDLSRHQHRLAYVQNTGETNIWRVQIGDDSSAAPLVVSTRWDLHPQFSPDGSRIAFTSNRSGSYDIWRSDHDGSNAVRLTSFGGPFTSTPRWSPDGTHLVFTARSNGQADLYTIDADGMNPRQLTTSSSDEMAASWSPNGGWIYFSSNRSGSWNVWRIPAAGGKAKRITTEDGFGPRVSPDGRWVYYAKHNAAGLWRIPLAGGEEEQVLGAFDPRDWGSWTIHDAGLYYLQRGQPTILAYRDFATGRTDTLFTPARRVPGMDPAFAVSPDGQWLLFGQVDRFDSDLMLVEDFN
ncbi:MAG TPA: DPP IV N-terminal domain-containing protein [Rhodothermales bacterium]|nr:DPP IV N-terminal domain-containing protein [Rhodothermales bacterium]